jgi:hypothetical protein
VEDMMQVSAMNPQKILFSPFVMTPEVTDSHLLELSVEEMMRLISSSETFMRDARAFFILGTHSSRGKTRDELRGLTQSHGLVGKVRWIGDSSEYVRISYDGRVIDSMTALSPSSYIKMATHCLSLKSVQDFKNIV